MLDTLKSQKTKITRLLTRSILRFCVDSLTHRTNLANLMKTATPPTADDNALSARIDRLLGHLRIPSAEAEAVDFLYRNLQGLTSEGSRADPAALLDLIDRRIARHTVSPIA